MGMAVLKKNTCTRKGIGLVSIHRMFLSAFVLDNKTINQVMVYSFCQFLSYKCSNLAEFNLLSWHCLSDSWEQVCSSKLLYNNSIIQI